MRRFLFLLLIAVPSLSPADDEYGHSKHGSAFDSGMRTRPWDMTGIGNAPFPITSKNPEVQKWFDQGNALLHSFWFEEAERSFRWCLKLDPDCAMAYWSLARCGFNWFSMGSPSFDDKEFDRYKTFLKEAVRRKEKVTERERLYIEAWEKATAPETKDHVPTLNGLLQEIVIKFPDDIEAKALLSLFNIGNGSAYANQLLIDQVLAKNPMHPGAHHAAIHNWDGVSSEQGIKSCELYGKAAPGIGHSLHMPGHIYSKIGMWHEAAIAMDSATRIELRYMNDRLALPFETWNYPHNRNYLCYIQEQLGMEEASLQGSRDMLAAPRDPEANSEESGRIAGEGHVALVRALIKFERWDEILKPGVVQWMTKDDMGKFQQAFAETLALNGTGKTREARERLTELKALQIKITAGKPAESYEVFATNIPVNVTEGLVSNAEGHLLEGQRALLNAAEADKGFGNGDPPMQAWPVVRLLGDDYRKRGENKLAIECYERALKQEKNDAFSLSGLALAYYAMGDKAKATEYAGRLEYVWSQADPDLKWLAEVRKLGLNAKPVAVTPAKERVYQPKSLDALGPMNWRPFAAPALQVLDVDGKKVQLADYAGQNVLLVFFLGEACVHCVGQLKTINDRMGDFSAQDTVVLAVCSATPDKLKQSEVLGKVGVKFLSDTNHENARRFASYDDFEEIELHSTILIDKQGRVRWKRTGGDPFTNMDFLLGELKRVNAVK
ncbi:MAG: redoxin domain-containing protein [Chthonomonadaceae bacterium]|nr:redoxin domain-containing protein [Chthonomonadaceae bacterium]